MNGASDAACRAFLEAYPGYSATSRLDELRARDYARLDRLGHVYLDYTGGGLYAESQVRGTTSCSRDGVSRQPALAQPDVAGEHASSSTRRAQAVLEFFNADPAEYDVDLHAERERGAQARRRVVSVRARRRATC